MATERETAIEAALQEKGLNAPRLTPADIDAAIIGETFTILPSGKCMICELTPRNGFTVRGEAAVVSIENFNPEIGQRIAREDARKKIWPLEAYRLQQTLFEPPLRADAEAEGQAEATTAIVWQHEDAQFTSCIGGYKLIAHHPQPRVRLEPVIEWELRGGPGHLTTLAHGRTNSIAKACRAAEQAYRAALAKAEPR